MPFITTTGSLPCCTACAEIRLFWIEFGSLDVEVCLACAAGRGIVGRSVRALKRLSTCSNVGAAVMRALGSILASGMGSQSRSVASREVWSYGVSVGDRKTVPA